MKNKKILNAVAAIAFATLLFVGFNYFNFNENSKNNNFSIENFDVPKDYNMSVHFIDVGDADSIYINLEDKNILIDSGDLDLNNKVTEYLKRHEIKKLDLVIVTHPHRDHIGGMSDIIKNFEIDRFLMPHLKDNVMTTTKTYENMLTNLISKKIKVEEPKSGTNFNIGNMRVDILAPNAKYDDINNYSIVTKITYGNKKFLFTGDAEKESEEDILNMGYDIKADVLKIGHHGSKTSTSQKFLNSVKPKCAVISSSPGKHNHPHKSTLNKLDKNNIKIFRTDQDGTIIFFTDGNDFKIKKEKNI